MPTYYTGDDDDGIALSASGDTWINRAGTAVSVNDSQVAAFDFGDTDDNALIVRGTIEKTSCCDAAISIGSDGVGNSVEVAAGGVVAGWSFAGIDSSGSGTSVDNAGLISCGRGGFGVRLTGGDSALTNSGAIETRGWGVSFNGGAASFDNSGTIRGTYSAVTALVDTFSGTNSGRIVGVEREALWIESRSDTTFTNDGLIRSATPGAVVFAGHGTADTLVNSGRIVGWVTLGGGHDLYTSEGGGDATGEIAGGSGRDTLLSGSRGESLDGGDGADELHGGGGADTLDGGLGANLLFGGAGDDSILSHFGDDSIDGGSGDDTLHVAFNRTEMSGGSGSDTFVIEYLEPAMLRSTIDDFEDDRDVLDLTARGYASVEEALADASDVADGVLLVMDRTRVKLLGITVAALADDILV